MQMPHETGYKLRYFLIHILIITLWLRFLWMESRSIEQLTNRKLGIMVGSSGLCTVSLDWLIPNGIAVYLAYHAVFNLFWHLLAVFPGPPIAVISTLYKAHIDLVLKGSFVHILEKLYV